MASTRRAPRTMLEYLIQQRERTYEEMADAFLRLEEPAAISARHLGRLARGERGSAGATPATRRALQAMFGMPLEELLRPWTPELVIAQPATDDGSLVLPSPGNERSLIRMAAERARRFTLLAAESTTPEAVEQLRDDVQRLALAYPQRPLTELLGDMVETQDTLFALLERRQTPQQARKLHFLTAVTSGLLAKASHDLADPHAAMLQARTAVLCADQADHNGLRAWLRGLQSMVAYWAGRYAEAVRYAEAGTNIAAGTAGTTSVWLPVSAARGYAALGNSAKALSAIRAAEEAWNRVEPDEVDELGGICTFNQPRTLYYAADALAWLPNEADQAVDFSTRAVNAYANPNDPAWAFGDQAGSHSDLAIARIAARDLEGAVEAVRPVLELPPSQRINGIIHSVQRVHQAVTRAGLAVEGRDLLQQIEDFTSTPLKALPR
ncbi:XRE family transcriptional regulator [Micromonospora chalcea]|uniref:XRE family transcriptional regulator n=1 Tax=Micromonospora chalcea TaxID=1874 RepID=UPI0021A62620|nr:XRE family transcriptional regulator [Micromonospora chalcea]MCT2278489.1 XRE family transcriptional regulator [Micromonospora chalcea]